MFVVSKETNSFHSLYKYYVDGKKAVSAPHSLGTMADPSGAPRSPQGSRVFRNSELTEANKKRKRRAARYTNKKTTWKR